jgi:hypothetical protein
VARPPIVKSTLVTSSRRVVLWPGSTKKPSRSRSTLILKHIERDFDMTAQQALDYSIVDTIIKKYNRIVTPNSTSL